MQETLREGIVLDFIEQSASLILQGSEEKIVNQIEVFARTCFQSETKEDKLRTENFVKRLVEKKHESVLEHFNFTARIITDRAMSHALVRHRHTAFTQESTHYIDYAKAKNKFTFIIPTGLTDEEKTLFMSVTKTQMLAYLELYDKVGRDKSRVALPMSLKTELIMTTNIREWLYIFKLRLAFDHPQMLALLGPLREQFKGILPIFFEEK